MDCYLEDLSYYNNFWNNPNILHSHFKAKYMEFKSLGYVFHKLANLSGEFSVSFLKAIKIADKLEMNNIINQSQKIQEQESFYIPLDKPDNSTRSAGIKQLLEYFERFSKSFNYLKETFSKISFEIFNRQNAFNTIIMHEKNYFEKVNKFQNALNELKQRKDKYYKSIEKAIEFHLSHLNKTNNKNKDKIKKEENKYLAQVKLTEELRADFTRNEGQYFYNIEDLERNCTNDLKSLIKIIVNNITLFQRDIGFKESEFKLFEDIDGNKDIQIFSKANKSLISTPKRIFFKRYKLDMKYYMENFQFLKKEISNKSPDELKIFSNNIYKELREYINEITFKENDPIKVKIIDISKNLIENKLKTDDFYYLMDKFEEKFQTYMDWKQKNIIDGQFYKKVGPEYDDRNSYAQTFLEFFKQVDKQNICLNAENFLFLSKAMGKILELNVNEDIDYEFCNIIINLSSIFYTFDNSKKSGKRYSYEIIRTYPKINKQGFWEGLSRFLLNQEMVKQKIYKEGDISADVLSKIIIPKIEVIIFTLMKLMTDSKMFNKIVYDLFKYFKIDKENIIFLVNRVELNASKEEINHIAIDKDLILSEL